jgi:heptosyltransferase-3
VSDAPFHRALVIRGGALGDFVLTLPVLQALRAAAPSARLEVLAYPGLAALAQSAGIIDDARSIEYGPLAGFFTRGTVLDPALRTYFGSFDLVISYLYDPDGIFLENVRAAGAKRILTGPHRPQLTAHAIDQLAAPLAELGVPLAGRAVRLSVTPTAQPAPTLALHPGSGSAAKNWPPEHWRQLADQILADHSGLHLAVIGGEADTSALEPFRDLANRERVTFWENLPLPDLASRLAAVSIYVGHDTGVSHLAASAGAPCLLLFGPTDPGVWAPPHDHVRVLRASGGRLEDLAVNTVMGALRPFLSATRLATDSAPSENPRS